MNESVANRLRKSKLESMQRHYDNGVQIGRRWAEQQATAEDLALLADEDDFTADFTICDVADVIECEFDRLVGDIDIRALNSTRFAAGFLDGALAVATEYADVISG